jgi:hypothetical protein
MILTHSFSRLSGIEEISFKILGDTINKNKYIFFLDIFVI